MEEIRLCAHCKKNHAARCYEYDKKDPTKRAFYCLECYSHLFLDEEGSEENALSECPYCGTTLTEVKTGKLVGCIHCYRSMRTGIFPMIAKMQGTRAHTGKTPPLDEKYGDPYDFTDTIAAEYREKATAQARYERQRRELQTIIDKLEAEGDFEGARCYKEKLTAMQKRSAIEEDFVWRTRRSLSKQP